MNFKRIQEFVTDMNRTNSLNDKKECLTHYSDMKQVLSYVYDSSFTYGIKSTNLVKNSHLNTPSNYTELEEILEALKLRAITGHTAIGIVNNFVEKNQKYEYLIHKIIDRNIDIRVDVSVINKALGDFIPTFDVALAKSYEKGKTKLTGNWYASTKLDGVRDITICTSENINTYSREGNEFLTLDVIKSELSRILKENGIESDVVFDGEICLLNPDGSENFQGVMKEIRKKDHTIKAPKYFIFDMLSLSDFYAKSSTDIFSVRQSKLNSLKISSPFIEVLPQRLITSDKDIEEMMKISLDTGHEGLILRKDTVYEGKRTNNLLKVKEFYDAEYQVLDVEYGEMDDGLGSKYYGLSNIIIEHKGFKVSAGSGFSRDQRKQFLNKDLIVGKWVTIKYFEETQNEQGGLSLRFPTVKAIYDSKRDV